MCHLLIILYNNNDKRMLAFIRKYPNEKSINAIGKKFEKRYEFKLNITRRISFTPPCVKIFLQK